MQPLAASVRTLVGDSLRLDGGKLLITDRRKLVAHLPEFVRQAVFTDRAGDRTVLQRLLLDLAPQLRVTPSSIFSYYRYLAGSRELTACVPAINLRALTFDSARALFRAARRTDTGAFAIEIARSEMGYTDQRPLEFAAVVTAAAVVEGFTGPVFLQGDHFQVRRDAFHRDAPGEIADLKALIEEALAASFLNIDIDASTLVDLSRERVEEQQAENVRQTVALARHVREHEPAGCTVSLGAEIGEVGAKDMSSPDELRAFMDGFRQSFQPSRGTPGVSKLSVQSGTRHGGVVAPDGSVAPVTVSFDTLRQLSAIARREFGLAGVVQHGASTLPPSLFPRFATSGAVEIHLSTHFQSMLFDHPQFPPELTREMDGYIAEHFAGARIPGDTDAQFLYRQHKEAIGPFKRALWDLPEDFRATYRADLEQEFVNLFTALNVTRTASAVAASLTASLHP